MSLELSAMYSTRLHKTHMDMERWSMVHGWSYICFKSWRLHIVNFDHILIQSPGSICKHCEKSCSCSSCLGRDVLRGLQSVDPAPPNAHSAGPVKLRTWSCMMSCSKQGGRTQLYVFSAAPELCPISVQVRLHQRTPSALWARKLSRVPKVTPKGTWRSISCSIRSRIHHCSRGNRSDAANWRANLLMWGALWIVVRPGVQRTPQIK